MIRTSAPGVSKKREWGEVGGLGKEIKAKAVSLQDSYLAGWTV